MFEIVKVGFEQISQQSAPMARASSDYLKTAEGRILLRDGDPFGGNYIDISIAQEFAVLF